MSDYHKDGKIGFERNITILTMQVERLERELKDARERNEVQNKYWHDIGVERNSLKESQPKLLKHIVSIEKVNAELKEKVSELETELYFCNRNKQVEEIVDGS